MKVLVGYPPTESEKGTALLSQNRQFQWFTNPTYLFPIIPASAATLLKEKGFDVIWKDSIVEKMSEGEFIEFIERERPDVFAFETKTPVVIQHWKFADKLKRIFPFLKIVIMGDHVTAFPKESLEESNVDFVITGGDYDFSLFELCNFLEKGGKMPKGIYYRKGKAIKNSGKFILNHSLDSLPFIDRELTKGNLYQIEYNLKYKPYAYLVSSRDCWYGKCKFCAWPQLFPKYRTRSVNNVLDEIKILIEKYKVKEIFNDAGTQPVGKWLDDFCSKMIEKGYNKKIKYSCNMRFGALNQENYNMMKKAGFRLLKFGLESANQATLDRLSKGIKVKDIIDGCKMAKNAGLTVHLTMIMGYPWETKQDALNTLKLAKWLMLKGYADVLQATVLVPYPGTALWKEAKNSKWFRFPPYDYERYDMTEPVLKTKFPSDDVMKICDSIYTKIFFSPIYIARRFVEIRSLSDVKFILNGVKAVFGHIKDFARK